MSEKYSDFIIGKDFTNNDIKKILIDNNIEGKILTVQYRPFKKIFIKIEDENSQLFMIKICLDKHSIELAQNESRGYANLDKIKFKSFNRPDFKLIMNNELMSISKTEFIIGSKGNFFEFNKFYNYDNHNVCDLSTVGDYIENLKFKTFKSNNIPLPEDVDNYIKKIINQKSSLKIPITSAHGDFAHYNSIKTNNKKFIYDLEFYDQKKILFYDFFHWHIMSYVYRLDKLKKLNFLIFCSPLYFYLLKKFCLYHFIKKDNILKNLDINLILKIFLIEKTMYLLKELKLNNLKDLMSDEQINFNYRIYKIFKKFL